MHSVTCGDPEGSGVSLKYDGKVFEYTIGYSNATVEGSLTQLELGWNNK